MHNKETYVIILWTSSADEKVAMNWMQLTEDRVVWRNINTMIPQKQEISCPHEELSHNYQSHPLYQLTSLTWHKARTEGAYTAVNVHLSS
jgi:hypothetical protein